MPETRSAPVVEDPDAAPQLRRQPSQQRAHDRVQRILDAADQLLATEGAPALGTKQVAQAAGISIGSLYHWFPDKESIAKALATRYWDELSALIESVADTVEQEEMADPIGAVINVLAAGFRGRPGFLAMWFSPLRTEELREVTRANRDRVAAAVGRILAVTRPATDPQTRDTVAAMVTLLGDGLLREAFRRDRTGDELILAEGGLALRAYVNARLGSDG
jgi:AcrR family transcriptional regulator